MLLLTTQPTCMEETQGKENIRPAVQSSIQKESVVEKITGHVPQSSLCTAKGLPKPPRNH